MWQASNLNSSGWPPRDRHGWTYAVARTPGRPFDSLFTHVLRRPFTPKLLAARRLASERSGVSTAIEEHVLTSHEARMDAAQKSAGRSELFRLADPPHRDVARPSRED